MNEQLVVKNFGPITNATVDFKRVTVFIGPTGGGKSTLAKIKAIICEGEVFKKDQVFADLLALYGIESYRKDNYQIFWINVNGTRLSIKNDVVSIDKDATDSLEQARLRDDTKEFIENEMLPKLKGVLDKLSTPEELATVRARVASALENLLDSAYLQGYFLLKENSHYILAERLIVATLNAVWPTLLDAKIALPKPLLDFTKAYLKAVTQVASLTIPFLDIEFSSVGEQSFVRVLSDNQLLRIDQAASGIQSVTPLLVLLEHLSRNTEQAQSFIIEEPELNLYPTAQRDLVYWLLEKCTQGENDLTITTHSPYVLSALNLALYANKVATLFPHQRKKVAKLIPEKYWLKAEEFSAYFVAKGGAKSIFDTKTGLLSESQLDEVSGEFADVFDRLTDLRVPEKKVVAKANPAKK